MGATAIVAETSSFDGLYKPSGAEFENWDCKTVGEDRGAFEIDGNVVISLERYCTLSNPVNVSRMSAVLFDAECAVEGTEYAERIMLMPSNIGVFHVTDNFVAEWQRCETK